MWLRIGVEFDVLHAQSDNAAHGSSASIAQIAHIEEYGCNSAIWLQLGLSIMFNFAQ